MIQTNIPKGYQQTAVGLIPQDWDIGNFQQFWNVTDCKHLTAEFIEVGIPVASIREVQSRFVELENAKQTTETYYLELIEGGRKPQPGDLIFSRNATVGEVAQVAEWHPPFAMGQDVCLLRKKQPEFSSDYLQAIIQSPIVIKQLADLMVGSTFKRVNVEQIRNLIVPMPSSEEQKTIAQALSDADAAIAELDRLITKKHNLKQGAMQELLTGKKRLPGFSGEWEVKKLGEIGECIIGLTYKPENVKEDGLLVLRSSNIADNQLKFEDNVFVDVEVSEKLITKEGDILICVRNGSRQLIGKTALIDKMAEGLTFGAFMSVYRTKFYEFVFHAFQSNHVKRQIHENIGATINQITNKNLSSFQILLPPLEEQKAIAQVLSDMDTEIEALEQKRNKYKAIKQGMMQELLTGRTRLV